MRVLGAADSGEGEGEGAGAWQGRVGRFCETGGSLPRFLAR